MKLPKIIDYQQAVQWPSISFVDPTLKQGTIRLDARGIPTVASGGFALTFDVTVGNDRFAVRCFKKVGDHLQDRYAAIAQFVEWNQGGLDFLIDVRYLIDGIRVNGSVFPIVRMPWITGVRLDTWVDRHLGQPQAIDNVRAQLTSAVARMRAAGIAHGDLQHGNVMIDNADKIRLIDYDGMFLPSLARLGTSEFGHRNYQHPERATHYDGDLDCFASSVIDLSLEALKYDPDLWKLNTSENLIFESTDFADPEQSEAFGRLLRIAPLADRTKRLMAACAADFDAVPAILSGERTTVRVPRPTRADRRSAVPQAIPAGDRDAMLAHLGDEVTAVGKVFAIKPLMTKFNKPMTLINFGDYRLGSFTIVAYDQATRDLRRVYGASLAGLENSWVSITGLVTPYDKGSKLAPQIQLERLQSLRKLDEAHAKALLATESIVKPTTPGAAAPTMRTDGQYRLTMPKKPNAPTQAAPAATPAPTTPTAPAVVNGQYRWSAPPRTKQSEIERKAAALYAKSGFVHSTAPRTQPPKPTPAQAPPPAAPQTPPTYRQPTYQQTSYQQPPTYQTPMYQRKRSLLRRIRDRLGL